MLETLLKQTRHFLPSSEDNLVDLTVKQQQEIMIYSHWVILIYFNYILFARIKYEHCTEVVRSTLTITIHNQTTQS